MHCESMRRGIFVVNLTYLLFLRAVVNIPTQTLTISPWLFFRKMIVSQLELGLPVRMCWSCLLILDGRCFFFFNCARQSTTFCLLSAEVQKTNNSTKVPFRFPLFTIIAEWWHLGVLESLHRQNLKHSNQQLWCETTHLQEELLTLNWFANFLRGRSVNFVYEVWNF